VVDLLTLVADRCVEILEVDAAGILLVAPEGDLRVMASSSDAMRGLELFELQADEGPCLDCYRTGQPVVNQQLAEAKQRWPRFTPVAFAAGYQNVHAIPMRLRRTVIGALNMFQHETFELSAPDVQSAQALADIATIAILQQRAAIEANVVNDQLKFALSSRIVIEQAKGVVAERHGTPMQEAFSLMRRYARQHNLQLADVARDIIAGNLSTGDLSDARPT
jgi:transcriptional regulator with GAF, ATPase, and Fis domain